ncbi:MAG: hypothetical protein ABI905_18060 [Betaproteobacteria bacterium]
MSSHASRFCRIVVLVLLTACVRHATAQTTTGGNVTTGQALWTSKGCAGCHAVNTKPVNAADAGGHILYAIAQGMPASVTVQEATDIAAYIGSNIGSPVAIVVPDSGPNAIAVNGLPARASAVIMCHNWSWWGR